MKRTASEIKHELNRNRTLFFLCAIFTVGVGVGVFSIRAMSEPLLGELSHLAENELVAGSGGFSGTMASTFASSFICLLLEFCCGFCAIGQPFAVAVIFVRGIAFGSISASLYAQQGFSVAPEIFMLIAPDAIFSAVVLVFACRESMQFAGRLFRRGFGETKTEKSMSYVKIYCIKFIIFTMLLLLGSAIKAAIAILPSLFSA